MLNDLAILHLKGPGDTMTWTRPKFNGTPPGPRAGHTMTIIGCNLYIFAGGDAQYLNDLHIFNTGHSDLTFQKP